MPHFERLHLGRATGLAAAFDHGRHLIVNPHEGERPAGLAAAGQLFAMAAQRAEVGPRAAAELEEHRLAAGELHDVLHVVVDVLNEAGRALRILVGILRLHHVLRGGVPPPVALRARHAVLVVQAHVEPYGRVERPVLVQAQPGQVAVEPFAVGRRGEVAVFDAPVGDRAGDAVDELLDAVFAVGALHVAVEVLAANDVGRQLGPKGRNFAVGLLEQHFAVLAFDGGGADFPVDGVEQVLRLIGAEGRIDLEPTVESLLRGGGAARRLRPSLTTSREISRRHENPPAARKRRASLPMYTSTRIPANLFGVFAACSAQDFGKRYQKARKRPGSAFRIPLHIVPDAQSATISGG